MRSKFDQARAAEELRARHTLVRAIASAVLTATALLIPGLATSADAWTLHSALGAPSALKLAASVRVRHETLDGQPRPGFNASDELLSLRTTFLVEYNFGGVRFGAELYDSRAYLGDSGSAISTGEVNAMEFPQLYLAGDVANTLGSDVSTEWQVGRLMLNLGSRRLVAADDYRNTTSSYTGGRVDLKRKAGGSATLVYTLPQRRIPDDLPSLLDNDIRLDEESSNAVLWGALLTTPKFVGSALDIGFFRFAERDSSTLATRNRQLDTPTVRWFRDPAPARFDFEVEGAWQSGNIRASTAPNAATLKVDAWFYHARVGYQWKHWMKPRLALEYDVASGEDSRQGFNRFDTLFGMRRADFAPSGIYAALGRANLKSPGLRFEFAPTPRLDGFVMYRALWLESATDSFSTTGVRDPLGASGDYAGGQIDSRLRYWIIPQALRFELDAVWLDKGRFLREAPNAPQTGNTTYVSLNLTTTF
jgi:hypothetical protein